MHVTHLGTATLLMEFEGSTPFRILTDPALDPSGQTYGFGFGTRSVKILAPALTREQLPPIDLVLLSHDHHADNLDSEGRKLLPGAKKIITTTSGAVRLKNELGEQVVGLNFWESYEIKQLDGTVLKITATPARHGQFPIPKFVIGDVIGFVLEWKNNLHPTTYLSGDTVWIKELIQIPERFKIENAFLHLGCVRFGLSGKLRYTFNGEEAARFAKILNSKNIIPIHYAGWSHFKESWEESRPAFEKENLIQKIKFLSPGIKTSL